MDRPPPRTLLEQLVRQSCRTIEETCAGFDQTARIHGEKATLSSRQLSRWLAGKTTLARPVAQRVALLYWGYDFERLVGRPMTADSEPASQPAPSMSPAYSDTIDWPTWFGLHLANLMAIVDSSSAPAAAPDVLQAKLNREVAMFDTSTVHADPACAMSRRQALIAVAAFPVATVASGSASPELFLARCAASLAACWRLLAGTDLRSVAQAVGTYLPELETAACRESGPRELAARLAAQAHRICGIVALHRDRLASREHHCKQAVRFASTTSDVSGQASALVSLASTYFYADDPLRAATTYEQALALESSVPPLQRARVHAELAVVYGQLGRERDALSSVEWAERQYPAHPEQDPSFLYAEFTRASLILEQGLAFLALAERFPGRSYQRVAANVFSRIDHPAMADPVPDRIRYEVVSHQARAAVLLNDLDAVESYLQRAIAGAAALGSKQRQREAQGAWTRAVGRWPRERGLADLADRVRAL